MTTNQAQSPRLIDLRSAIRQPVMRTLFRLVEQPVNKMLSLETLDQKYAESLSAHEQGCYFPTALETLNVTYDLSDEDRANIPLTGPLVVVANHPFGAVEGLILGDLLTRLRPDVRLLGNHLLHTIPLLRDWIIPVDPFGGSDAAQSNVAPLKACLRWLRGGGVLGAFPAGAVSHLRVREGGITDPPWHPGIATLIRRSGATVVPLFFEGRNSMVFQLAGLIHGSLRTALIPSEMLKRSDSCVGIRVGRPITPDKFGRYEDDATLITYLRWKTQMLKRRESPVRPRFLPKRSGLDVTPPSEPVAEAEPTETLVAEIANLPAGALLCEAGEQQVYLMRAAQAPALMREIGRLREKTFRAVSEGTGRALDLDNYDESYLHLVLWHKARAAVIGSYRLGRVDELMEQGGVPALYTSSLFKFREGFLNRLGPALELGRSFIRQEDQRKPTALALLWRGIGEYLVRNPHYKVLFGPVSISRDYQSLSRRIMVEFLSSHRGDEELQRLVRAKNPPKERLHKAERAVLDTLVKDVDDISTLVEEVEEDNKGMPVLLRHYLRLGARLLSFNVDPAFGNCVDGLIVVDLRSTDARILNRFMGEEGLKRFSAVP